MRRILLVGITLLLILTLCTTMVEAGKGGGRKSKGGGGRSKAKATRNHGATHRASGGDRRQGRVRRQSSGETRRSSGETRRTDRRRGHDQHHDKLNKHEKHEKQSKKTKNWDSKSKAEKRTGRKHASQVQRRNEERKLQHRRETAQHLRDIAKKNGNDRLLDTADRMEQRAQEHYKSRLERIDQFDRSPRTVDDVLDETENSFFNDFEDAVPNPVFDALNSALQPDRLHGDAASRLKRAFGRNNALERRLLNEDRQLQRSLGTAQHLRDLAAENGNNRLLQAADQMEQMAVELYEGRLEKLGGFQDQFSVPGPNDFITIP